MNSSVPGKSMEQVQTEVVDRVLTIRMNRPEKKNALTSGMYEAMSEAIRASDSDSQVRVLLITGTQDCFTAGNDIADFAAANPGSGPVAALVFLETLAAARKPVIAAVAGVAVGIGTTLLFHCDLVYAAPTARFQLPFVNLGLCPEAGSSYIFPALVGTQKAAEVLFFGEPFGAEAAREYGLVNQIIAEGDLLSTARAKARTIAEKPPSALQACKALLKRSSSEQIRQAMTRESEQFARALQGPEAKEAMAAFLERRKPDFSRF